MARDQFTPIRANLEEKLQWEQAAAKEGISVSEWIRNQCNQYEGILRLKKLFDLPVDCSIYSLINEVENCICQYRWRVES